MSQLLFSTIIKLEISSENFKKCPKLQGEGGSLRGWDNVPSLASFLLFLEPSLRLQPAILDIGFARSYEGQ